MTLRLRHSAHGRWVRPAVAWVCLGIGLVVRAGATSADAFWMTHVDPVLEAHCRKCHNPTKARSGLDLTSLATLLRGGDRGAAVVPGRPDDSPLIQLLAASADPHMPPKGQLSEEEVGVLQEWIRRLGESSSKSESGTHAEDSLAGETSKPARWDWVPPADWSPVRVIDRYVEHGWDQRGVRPAKPVDDAAWVRRVYLDLAGRVPSTEERDRFLKDRRRDRRDRLVDELLSGPEWPRHLAEVMDVVLMGRRGPDAEAKREKHRWFAYLEMAFRENRPWDRMVRELIVARPELPDERGAAWYLYERKGNPQSMAEAVAPVVFGVRIQCAQCHDHMVAREIKQAHYWGLVAAFNRTKNVDTPAGPGLSESAIGGFVSFANLKKESQPALMTLFNGRTIDEPWPKDGEKEVDAPEKYQVPPPADKQPAQAPAVPKFSRRAALAEAVGRDNPLLARAMVNRLWALLMGRGLVHPVDLMDSKHPPSHPELLDWLAQDFAAQGYDIRRLVRTLTQTRAYQLDSRPRGGRSMPPEAFACAVEKPLSAEQLYRSLLEVTGSTPDDAGLVAGRPAKEVRQAFIREFPDLFPAEYSATLQQAMFLSNSPVLDVLLEPRGDNLTAWLLAVSGARERAREAVRTVLGREPDREEWKEATRYLEARTPESGVKQLVWALVTSTEFQTNH